MSRMQCCGFGPVWIQIRFLVVKRPGFSCGNEWNQDIKAKPRKYRKHKTFKMISNIAHTSASKPYAP